MFRDFRRPAAPTLVPTLWRLPFVGFIVLGLLLIVRTPASAKSPLQNQMAKILADWKAREAEIRSLRMTWTQEKLIPRGSMPKLGPEVINRPPQDAVVPPEDVRLRTTHVFEIDGEKARFAQDGDDWSVTQNCLAPIHAERVWDGKTNSSFADVGGAKYPFGTVEAGRIHFMFTNNSEVLPVRLFARPVMPAFDGLIQTSMLRWTRRTGTVGESHCAILEQGPPSRRPGKPSGFYYEVWVDLVRASLPLRWMMIEGGSVTSDLKIQYVAAADGQLTLSGWTLHQTGKGPGAFPKFITATVDEFLLNPEFPPSHFTMNYPAGTMVGDKTAGRRPEFHVVRSDGSRRDLQPGESSDDYQKIVQPPSHWYTVGFWGALLLATAIGIRLIVHLRSRA